MTAIARRLPHVVTRGDLVALLAPTYVAERDVDDEEARDRLARALEHPALARELYDALASAIDAARGPRTTEDAVVDKISAAVARRRALAKPAPSTAALSAALVRIDLELGLAAEQMRATLATPKAAALLQAGFAELARHVVKDLLRG